MKTSEVLKMLEQMHRDKRSPEDIHTATARYREMAEAEEAAQAQKPKPPPRVDFGIPPFTSPV